MNRTKVITSIVLIALLATACATPTPPPEEVEQVTAVVEEFGRTLQRVSLLSPSAADDIQEQYAPYVSPKLLAQWVADPTQAPGRLTSSPWPDRIEITSVRENSANEYEVTGNLIEATSAETNTTGISTQVYVIIILQKDEQGNWLITGFQER